MNDKNQKQNSGLDGREIPAVCILLGCAGWYKYGNLIEVWFYNNMMKLAVCGVLLLIAFGYFLYWRMQKKDREEIKRMQRLAQAKAPTRQMDAYYKRNPKDRDAE